MHGLIHSELVNYIKQKRGLFFLQKVMEKAQLSDQVYLPVGTYPDEEVLTIVTVSAKLMAISVDDFLESFGFYLAAQFIERYRSYVDPQWKTLELLLNTEQTIHRVVRLKDKCATPPRLKFSQIDENRVCLEYNSPRKLQALARGMVKGVADWYGERVRITERSNAETCQFEIAIKQAKPD